MTLVSGYSFVQARNALAVAFQTSWATTEPNVPIAWPNVPFDPDGSPQRDNGFVQVAFVPGDGPQASTSGGSTGKLMRQVGNYIVTVFAPKNTGEARGWELAGKAADILRAQPISGFVMGGANSLGATEDDEWFVVPISVPFHWDAYVT